MISELECRRGDLISSATVAYPGFSLHLVCSLLKHKKRSLHYILLVLVPLKLLTRNVNTGIVRIVGRPIGFSSRLPLSRPRPGAGGRVIVGVRVGYPE